MKAGLAAVALSVAGLTLAGRILGFGRWLVFSKTVGDTCLGDVYNAANSLPNALFEIVAGGVLAGVVIPVVARHVGAGRRAEAGETVSALVTWTLLVLTPAGLAALAGAGLYGRAFAKADCAGSGEVLAALLVMFVPQVWLYGLAVVSAGRAAGPLPVPGRGGRAAAVQRGGHRRVPGLRRAGRARRRDRSWPG